MNKRTGENRMKAGERQWRTAAALGLSGAAGIRRRRKPEALEEARPEKMKEGR